MPGENACMVKCKESFPRFWEPFKATESSCVNLNEIDLRLPTNFFNCSMANMEERRNLEEFNCYCEGKLCNERYSQCGIDSNLRSFPDLICNVLTLILNVSLCNS